MLGKFVTPRERRVAVILLPISVLVTALVSLIVGVNLLPTTEREFTGFDFACQDQADAARGWPASTPHRTPWPAPNYWRRLRRTASCQYSVQARGRDDWRNSFSMDLGRAGWPVPVVEVKRLWWNIEDPAWAGPRAGERAHVLYAGLAIDAVILGGGTWLVLALGLVGAVVAKRIARELCAEPRFVVMLVLFLMCVVATLETNFAWSKYRQYRGDASKLVERYWIDASHPDPVPSWPVRPPGPWERPNVWMADRAFGARHFDVRAQDEAQLMVFGMDVWNYGWPFPA